MPELPEVDAIAGVIREHAVGRSIVRIDVLRGNGKYLGVKKQEMKTFTMDPRSDHICDVFRSGKVVCFKLLGRYLIVHNAMTGYFDWEHHPWTFDYVEGKRTSTEQDVRVKIFMDDGTVLRFHDARLFGSMKFSRTPPPTPPELVATPNGDPSAKFMTQDEFFSLLDRNKPIKSRLMDQAAFGGVGNIYASEACHLAGINPSVSSASLSRSVSDSLFSSLQSVFYSSIPSVRYDWLKVYRRQQCGTCQTKICRIKLSGRSTFFCPRCQP